MKYLYLVFAFFLMPNLMAQAVNDSLLLATLERTTCYGKCPYYKIKVYTNGVILWEGKSNVENIGWYRTKISPRKISQLLERAYQIDYLNLENKYPIKGLGIIDFPTCITSLRVNDKEKMIYNRNDAPTKLIEYQQFFDELVENAKWKKLITLPSE